MLFQHKDPDRLIAYAAENAAFEDTRLAERPGAEALCAATVAVMDSLWWWSTFGPRRCGVEPAQRPTHDSCCFSLAAAVIEIRYAPTATRFTIAHELAHAATVISSGTRNRGHGQTWRRWYITITDVAFGSEWAVMLTDAFRDANLILDL
jgi:SprT-like family